MQILAAEQYHWLWRPFGRKARPHRTCTQQEHKVRLSCWLIQAESELDTLLEESIYFAAIRPSRNGLRLGDGSAYITRPLKISTIAGLQCSSMHLDVLGHGQTVLSARALMGSVSSCGTMPIVMNIMLCRMVEIGDRETGWWATGL